LLGSVLKYNVALAAIPMKSYVVTSGLVFGLITLAHILRVFAEGPRLAKEPWFILTSSAALALCLWAWRVLKGLSK
jgi:hypothetical protein